MLFRAFRRLVAGAFLVGGSILIATPASAGNGLPPCGSVCDFKDPAAYHVIVAPHQVPDNFYLCANDAKTVRHTAYVELRYSAHCETTWARPIVPWPGGWLISSVTIYSTFSSGTARTHSSASPANHDWSVMLDDHNLLNYACIGLLDNENDTTPTSSCTTKF